MPYPAWWYTRGGGKKRCDVCGAEYYVNERKLRKQRGLWVDDDCYDTLTDKERAEQAKKR